MGWEIEVFGDRFLISVIVNVPKVVGESVPNSEESLAHILYPTFGAGDGINKVGAPA